MLQKEQKEQAVVTKVDASPEVGDNSEDSAISNTSSTDRHFTWTLAWWCHRMEGSPFNAGELCDMAKALQVQLDLVGEKDWELVREKGVEMGCMIPDMSNIGPGGIKPEPFEPGFNDTRYANDVHGVLSKALDLSSKVGISSIVVFTGIATEIDPDQQYLQIVKGFRRQHEGHESLIEKAERLQVTFMMEMLNTKGDKETWRGHPGYLGNSTNDLVEKVIKPVNSSRLRLAFDIYHVSMMDEDPLDMIEKHHEFIGNVQVAGMLSDDGANRGEITAGGQMIDYKAVFCKLREKLPDGGKGIPVLLEYIPSSNVKKNVRDDLMEAIRLCEGAI